MFARAGRMGYVLKPELLRRKGLEKDKDSLVRSIHQILDIEVSLISQTIQETGTDKLSRLYQLSSFPERVTPSPSTQNRSRWIPLSKSHCRFPGLRIRCDVVQRSSCQ